ncbi:MAG: FAD-binding protein [Adlercreutzia sp.]
MKDGDRVSGIVVQNAEGDYFLVNAAKAIVLACGDFGNNQEMLEYYAPQATGLNCTYNCMDAHGDICNVGEGTQMALWAGATMEKAPYAPMSHLSDVADLLLVRRDGRRFINEELGAQSKRHYALSRRSSLLHHGQCPGPEGSSARPRCREARSFRNRRRGRRYHRLRRCRASKDH